MAKCYVIYNLLIIYQINYFHSHHRSSSSGKLVETSARLLQFFLGMLILFLSPLLAIVWTQVFVLLKGAYGCPFSNKKDFSKSELPSFHRSLRSGKSNSYTTGVCAKSNGATPDLSDANICSVYLSVKKDFEALIPDSEFERANLYGAAVRLAFHDAGEIDINSSDTMGPDGCLSSSSDNAGLVEETSLVNTVIEPLWQNYCDKISRADFWVLFAKLSMEYSDPTKSIKLDYQYGRQDKTVCEIESDRLPDAQYGMDMIEQVFVKQMGLTLEDAGITIFSVLF